jgi:hypothetical protein
VNDLRKLAVNAHGGVRRWEQISRFRTVAVDPLLSMSFGCKPAVSYFCVTDGSFVLVYTETIMTIVYRSASAARWSRCCQSDEHGRDVSNEGSVGPPEPGPSRCIGVRPRASRSTTPTSRTRRTGSGRTSGWNRTLTARQGKRGFHWRR